LTDFTLAAVEEATAHWYADHHLIRIKGTLPTPCHTVDLEQSPLDVEPPRFLAKWDPGPHRCITQVVPYDYREAFDIGARRDELVVETRDGAISVAVEDYAGAAQAAAESARVALSTVHDPLGGGELEPNEAVGYSRNWDFGEALRDAVKQLPGQNPGVPDWLSTYEVVAVGAQVGGIAGFNHLWVRARG
jgi:hypothetical protein